MSQCYSVKTYYPTLKEFSNFEEYVVKIGREGAKEVGVCKVVPPKGWSSGADYEDFAHMEALWTTPIIQEMVKKDKSVCFIKIREQKKMTFKQFIQHADRNSFFEENVEKRQKKFWQSLGSNGVAWENPAYGSDMPGSLFRQESAWNLNNLKNVLNHIDGDLPGITSPMLYFGSWRAAFGTHTEDLNLYSINYHHIGAPKSWYTCQPKDSGKVETIAARFFPDNFQMCDEFMRHKTIIIPPGIFRENGLAVYHILQGPGEFVITWPRAYHAGFNHGFNIAEAVNFATPEWIIEGLSAGRCGCTNDSVAIDVQGVETNYRRAQILEAREKLSKKQKALVVERMTAKSNTTFKRRKKGSKTGSIILSHLIDEPLEFRCHCLTREDYDELQSDDDEGEGEATVIECQECGFLSHLSCLEDEYKKGPFNRCAICRERAKWIKNTGGKVQPRKRVGDMPVVGDLMTMNPVPGSEEEGYKAVKGIVSGVMGKTFRFHLTNTADEEDKWFILDEHMVFESAVKEGTYPSLSRKRPLAEKAEVSKIAKQS